MLNIAFATDSFWHIYESWPLVLHYQASHVDGHQGTSQVAQHRPWFFALPR